MSSGPRSNILYPVLACGLAACGGRSEASAPPTFRASAVLHADVSADLEAAEADAAAAFAVLNPGVSITIDVIEPAELVDHVQQAVDAGEAPDLVIGHHLVGHALADGGAVDALCLDSDPFCIDACIDTPDPAPWCVYARGGGFGDAALGDYPVAAYCEPEGCPPECEGPNPPRWCALIDAGADADLWQASVATLIQEQVEPLGIPLSWDPQVVLVHEAWFAEAELPVPTTVAEVMDLLDADPKSVWADSSVFFDLTGSPAPREGDPSPDPMIVAGPHPQPSIVAAGDPSPDPMIVGIMIAHASTLSGLSQELLDALQPTAIEGYRPGASVAAVTPLPAGAAARRDLAVAFASFAYSEPGRAAWDDKSAAFPTSDGALAEAVAAHPTLGGAATLATQAQLVSLPPVLPTF